MFIQYWDLQITQLRRTAVQLRRVRQVVPFERQLVVPRAVAQQKRRRRATLPLRHLLQGFHVQRYVNSFILVIDFLEQIYSFFTRTK